MAKARSAKAKKTTTAKVASASYTPGDETLEEFKGLFKAARLEISKAMRRATEDGPAYQAALTFARAKQIPGAELLLGALLAVWTRKEQEAALASVQRLPERLPETLHGHAFNVQGLLLRDLKRWDEAIEYSQKALDVLGYDTPGMALNNMGLAYADKKDPDRAIECYQKALDTPGYDTPGRTLTNMGIAYRVKGDPDRAIECYQKALDSPGYDTPGKALNSMGLAYADKKDPDRAIECYQKALDSPGYDTPGKTLTNMGIAYRVKGNPDRAIECYQKAVDTPGYDTPGKALNNMGNAYKAKGEHDRAVECYQKALEVPGHTSPHLAHVNLAISLRALGRHEEALAKIQGVLEEPDTEGQHARARVIQRLIKDSLAGLQPTVAEEALAKPESKTTAVDTMEEDTMAQDTMAEDTPEQDMLQKLGYQEQGQKDKYDEYLVRPLPKREDGFTCLRGWSSAVTLLEGGVERQWAGGGYFLRWQGKGIVIDPGFDFVDNFHEAELHLKEVDAVLVSHNHSDHNYDLSSLDDLRYELHRRWRGLSEDDKQKHDVSRCLFAIDEDTARAFRDDNAEHRGFPMKFYEGNAQREMWLKRQNGLPVTIEHFKVEHGRDVPHAMGLRLRLHDDKNTGAGDFVFGYTGDTRWHPALAKHLQGCDVLLAHISMPAQEELLDDAEYEKHVARIKAEGGSRDLQGDGFKATHLGYRGMLELICETKPKIVIVGEFWAGLQDLRIDLIKGLRKRVEKRTGLNIPILPTGLGFRLRLPSLEVECTSCDKAFPHAELKIAPAASSFGPLGYLCPKCLG